MAMYDDDEVSDNTEEVDHGRGQDWDRGPVPPGFERDSVTGALRPIPENLPQDWNRMVLQGAVNIANSPETWPTILEACARTGRVEAAAAAVGCSGQTIRTLRKKNSQFAELWEQAMDVHRGRLKAEVLRRAVEGVTEPLLHKGHVVATMQKYSDNLLLAALRIADPEAREVLSPASTKVSVTATAQAAAIADASDGPKLDLRALTREQRDALRQLRSGAAGRALPGGAQPGEPLDIASEASRLPVEAPERDDP